MLKENPIPLVIQWCFYSFIGVFKVFKDKLIILSEGQCIARRVDYIYIYIYIYYKSTEHINLTCPNTPQTFHRPNFLDSNHFFSFLIC